MAQAVRGMLADAATSDGREAAMASPLRYDETTWRRLGQELGLAGLLVPERFDGLGLSTVDLAVVADEIGRHVLPLPFLSSAVLFAATLAATPDSEPASRWLPALAGGQVTGTVAVQETSDDYRCTRPTTTARAEGGTFLLTGTKRFVMNASAADVVLVLAVLDGAPTLFAVDRDAAGMQIECEPSLDPTLSLCSVRLDDTPGARIAGDAAAAVERGLDVLVLAQAAESLGGAEHCLAMAVEYAKTRFQFGRPIGSFQAIKHKCADVFVAVEIARTAVLHAAWALEADPTAARSALPAAAAEAARAFSLAAAENIQIHGGIGFTWEHSAHWYFKRARSYEVLNGTTAEHYAALQSTIEPTLASAGSGTRS
jgi:alkylation response protein AidB-like acyl-CoA dehydrogenase